jgi:lipopolysaccharide export system permease protein
MKKIFSLTTFSFLGPFVATFFVVLFTLLVQFVWKYIDDMVGKGLEPPTIMRLLFFASASFVTLALPLAILLSSIMAFGKMAETNELMALKCSGVSLIRIMLPLITVMLFMSAGAFYFANNLIPSANLKFHSLLYDIRSQRPALDIREGVFYRDIDNYSIRINKKDKKSTNIRGVKIYDHTSGQGNDVVMTADNGQMFMSKDKNFLVIRLFDGYRYADMETKPGARNTLPFNRTHFNSYEMKFDLSAFKLSRTNETLFKDHYEMLNIKQLVYYQDSMTKVTDGFRKDLEAGMKPYFQYERDTAYATHSRVKTKPFPTNLSIISSIDAAKRKATITDALINARNVKSIIDNQGKNIIEYEKVIAQYKIEWHRKFALSLACLTLFFIGAPLGAIIRKGGLGMPTVVSIIMFLVFYIISIMGEKSAKQGVIPAYIGMWIPTAVLLPIGFFLTWRANMDAINFSSEGIVRLFKKVKGLFKKKEDEEE